MTVRGFRIYDVMPYDPPLCVLLGLCTLAILEYTMRAVAVRVCLHFAFELASILPDCMTGAARLLHFEFSSCNLAYIAFCTDAAVISMNLLNLVSRYSLFLSPLASFITSWWVICVGTNVI